MRDLGRIVAQIPARGGSKRVPAKNLRMLCGKPMIAYAIASARACPRLDEVFVNTDSDAIAKVAKELGAQVYRRPAHLGSDDARGDDFCADFIDKLKPDTVVMINPVCPLIESSDIQRAIERFQQDDGDTLITCENTQMQVFCDGVGVNIDTQAPLAPTQSNPVVSILNWAVTIWDAATFTRTYRATGAGYLGTKRILLPIEAARAVKVSTEADFKRAELLMRARELVAADTPPQGYEP